MQTTIIIICYNWHWYLKEAIENVLVQEEPVKIMLLTDNSSQEVLDIAKEYKQVTVLNINDAVSNIERMNKAVEAVDTKYYIFQCVDDFLDNKYIKTAQNILNNNNVIDVVHCDIEKFGDEVGRWDSIGLIDGIKETNTMFFSSLIRKSLWERLGGYDINIPYGMLEDWDFWVRAYYAKAISCHLPKPYYKYRIHNKQSSKTIVNKYNSEIMQYLNNKWSQYA